MNVILFCAFLIGFVPNINAGVTKSSCAIDVTNAKNEESMPVVLTSSSEFYIPTKGKAQLNSGEEIVLACPNGKNYIELTKTASSTATCISGDKVKLIKGVQAEFDHINCTKGVRGTAVRTNKVCGDGQGKLIDIAFKVAGKTLPLIEVCYNDQTGNNLYSTNLLYGGEQKYASRSRFRPSFSTQGLGPNIPANTAYKRKSQKVVFTSLLGTAKLAEKYINDQSYLARGHMAPDADFLYAPWQYSTYFYVNVNPQWQVVNNGNWKYLEIMTRTAAEELDEYLQVYTGSYQVLSVPNAHGKLTELYLTTNKKIAVPKFVWKILYSQKSQKAIAFVNLNDPFATTVEHICKDVCKPAGWFLSSWTKYSKGFVYCCDANELLKVIRTGPSLEIKGVLEGPSKVSQRNLYEEDEDEGYESE